MHNPSGRETPVPMLLDLIQRFRELPGHTVGSAQVYVMPRVPHSAHLLEEALCFSMATLIVKEHSHCNMSNGLVSTFLSERLACFLPCAIIEAMGSKPQLTLPDTRRAK